VSSSRARAQTHGYAQWCVKALIVVNVPRPGILLHKTPEMKNT